MLGATTPNKCHLHMYISDVRMYMNLYAPASLFSFRFRVCARYSACSSFSQICISNVIIVKPTHTCKHTYTRTHARVYAQNICNIVITMEILILIHTTSSLAYHSHWHFPLSQYILLISLCLELFHTDTLALTRPHDTVTCHFFRFRFRFFATFSPFRFSFTATLHTNIHK